MVSAVLRTILVTGGASYIGSHTVLQLLQQGFRVVVVDNASEVALVCVAELAGHNSANLVFHKAHGGVEALAHGGVRLHGTGHGERRLPRLLLLYEDVAFRIVNREWERSRKAGFRCTFERGVLRLSFHFKRFFYRR